MHLASTTITLLVLIEPKKIIAVFKFMRTFVEPLLVVPHCLNTDLLFMVGDVLLHIQSKNTDIQADTYAKKKKTELSHLSDLPGAGGVWKVTSGL